VPVRTADAADVSPDLAPSPGAVPDSANDGMAGCTPLPYAWLSLEAGSYCPPSVAAACAGGDTRVAVARSQACIDAWNAMPFQCAAWPALPEELELVALHVPNCSDTITIDSALACADHIVLAYTINSACESCDGKHPSDRGLLLPRDRRPIIATRRDLVPPCSPPPGGCPQTPIDATQAAAAYAAYRGLSSNEWAQAEEKTVPGLWEEMHAQLFEARRYYDGGPPTTPLSFIYRECAITVMPDNYNLFGRIASGMATQGAFYSSWGAGSGIYRTNFVKLAPSGAGLVRTTSGGYVNSNDGPPPLVVALVAEQILVYRPASTPTDFNQWQGGELIGTLKDFGDRLGIVDGNGQEIPAEFPPF
jgi:hypothetical protein